MNLHGTSPWHPRSGKGINVGLTLAACDPLARNNLAEIEAGTSNTIAVSEILTSNAEADQRGAWAYPTGSFFSGGNQTDFSRDVRLPPNGNALDDRRRDKPSFCSADDGDRHLRCTANGGRPNVAARSRHSGGVHVLLADASVQFIQENIDLETWIRMLCLHDQGRSLVVE